MTTAEQAALLIAGMELQIISMEDVIKWADAIIEREDIPPEWILSLSMSKRSHFLEFHTELRKHASAISQRQIMQLIALAYKAQLFSFQKALQSSFRILIFGDAKDMPPHTGVDEFRNIAIFGKSYQDALDEQLDDALIEWDCQDDPEIIEPAFQQKCDLIFKKYWENADDIAAVLPWKLKRAV